MPIVREAFEIIASGTRAFTGDRGRHLILQCNLGFCVYWLVPRLGRLNAAHPWLVLNIVTPIWDPERSAGRAAVEIRFGRSGDVSASARRMTRERFYPVRAPVVGEGQDSPDDGRLFEVSGTTGSWDAWYSTQGGRFTRDNDVSICSTYAVAIAAVQHTTGWVTAHDSLVAGLVGEGRLVAPFDHKPAMVEGYFLLPPAEHATTPAARAFIDWLFTELAKPPGAAP